MLRRLGVHGLDAVHVFLKIRAMQPREVLDRLLPYFIYFYLFLRGDYRAQ